MSLCIREPYEALLAITTHPGAGSTLGCDAGVILSVPPWGFAGVCLHLQPRILWLKTEGAEESPMSLLLTAEPLPPGSQWPWQPCDRLMLSPPCHSPQAARPSPPLSPGAASRKDAHSAGCRAGGRCRTWKKGSNHP